MRVRQSKKADLSLSINAIVILILAITMLGLGLGFMKGMFGKTLKSFEDVGAEMQQRIIDDLKASNAKISFNRADITVKKGDSAELFFGIKNDEQEGEKTYFIKKYCTNSLKGECSGSTGGGSVNCALIRMETLNKKTIAQGEVAVTKLIIRPATTVESTSYDCEICVLKETDGQTCAPGQPNFHDKKEFFITIP